MKLCATAIFHEQHTKFTKFLDLSAALCVTQGCAPELPGCFESKCYRSRQYSSMALNPCS